MSKITAQTVRISMIEHIARFRWRIKSGCRPDTIKGALTFYNKSMFVEGETPEPPGDSNNTVLRPPTTAHDVTPPDGKWASWNKINVHSEFNEHSTIWQQEIISHATIRHLLSTSDCFSTRLY